MLVNVKLDVSDKRHYLSGFQTLLVFLILNGMAKTMLAILPFLCCGKIVKNSIIARRDIHGYILSSLKEMCGLSVKKDLNDWSMSIAEKSSQLQDVLEKLKDKEFLRPKLNDFNTRM